MKRKILYILVFVMFLASSCVVERTQAGNYNPGLLNQKTYAKGKDIYLFWNQVALQKTKPGPELKSYEKIVKRNVFDVVVTYGTAGIFSFYTVIIKTEKPQEKKTLKHQSNLTEPN